ncbi:hypothetical protein [Paracoccus beibuensis]|uniref:hypothetical protein n=1 Tax=Paracoccus beibuensis TaxID=547602 RepID=UPI00223EDBD2|nr:hypothetical protein [Paracoccus beibuensis]
MRRVLRLLPPALLAAWPMAAPAQEVVPFCSGQPAVWLGGAGDTSDISTAAAALAQRMDASDADNTYAVIRVSGAMQALRIEAEGVGTGDPLIRLETPDGDLLAENDDAVGLSSRIEQSVGPGDYCVRLLPVGNAGVTAMLQVTTPEMPPLLSEAAGSDIAACTAETEAEPLAEGPLEAALPAEARTDGTPRYLRFSVGDGVPLTLRAVSEGLDPNMVLFDRAGSQVAANDDADGLNARLDFPSGLAAGDYCLGVAPIAAGEGTITVSAAALDRDVYLRDAWRRGELPPPFDGDVPMQPIDLAADAQTIVLQDGSAQWLTFTLERETALIVSAHGGLVGVDSKLALFADNGTVVAQDDDSAGELDARLGPVVLQPGRYRMALTDVNRPDQPGAPIRPVALVFERFERVE